MKIKHTDKIRTLNVRNIPRIGAGQKAYIIAEIGTNHNRCIDTAKSLMRAVADAGCDCVKFQIYEPWEIVSGRVRVADYKLENIYGDISAQEMFERNLKTPKEWFPELRDLCHDLGMDFAATIHGSHGLRWAGEIGLDVIKIASMDHNNFPLLRSLVNKFQAPILVSLGMAELSDIDRAVDILTPHNAGFGLFHCCAVYPPLPDEVRLPNVAYLMNRYKVPAGFSDHTMGAETALDARSIGAMVFEKHVTLDRTQTGPDHSFAMEMKEFGSFVSALKQTPPKFDFAPGSYLPPTARELRNRSQYLKSVISRYSLPAGHVIQADDVYLARPGFGIAPGELENVLGCRLAHAVDAETPLCWDDLKNKT